MEIEHHADREQQRILEVPLPHQPEPGQHRPQRAGIGQPLQRQYRGLRHDRVGDQLDQRPDRHRVADGAQSVDRRELQPDLAAQEREQLRHRVPAPEPSQRLDGGLRDVELGVADQRQHGGRGRRVADPGQDLEREHHHVLVGQAEHGLEVRQGVGPLALQRGERRVAADRVRPVRHHGAQHAGLDVAGRQANGALAHRRRLVLQRAQDGRLAGRVVGQRVQRGEPLRDGRGSVRRHPAS
jgi:hypothetical protein